jgi:hypothetical protein
MAIPPIVNPNRAFQENVQAPAAQPMANAPTPPTPQINTPAAPVATPTTPTTTVNVNTPPTAPVTPATAQNTASATQPVSTSLTMPANGSVVDLLNAAGQDSSYEARQKLAQQYGIQGYQGTAQQNTDLSKKYLDAFNANKATPTPDTSSQARTAVDTYFKDNEEQADPQKTFFDEYMSMNPIVKTMYDQINKALSTVDTTTSFKDEFVKLQAEQGIPALNTELMNIKNIMDGTEDDIRNEITKAGGFATESQVQALTGARNKTLLKQANSLQQQLALKQDYVDQIMQFSQADRTSVEKQVDRKLGLIEKMAKIQEDMTKAAKDNYQKIIDTAEKRGENGYAYLANNLDSSQKKLAEKALGLPSGKLSDATFLSAVAGDKALQFVSGTENQASGVFNPNTGTFTARGGSGGSGSGSGAPGTVSGSVARDSESVMSGNLNLQDISTAKNYRAQVGAELNKRAQEALASGDIYGVMKASAAYDKEPSDTFTTSMEKLGTVLGQIGVLQENISEGKYVDSEGKSHSFSTGPIEGAFRGLNPWDTKAQTIKAQLNAIVPNLARGIYGEVGVLTDNDTKNYAKTLPNLKSTEDIRNAVLYITVDMIRKNAEMKIKNQAASQRDMSGYASYYRDIVNQSNNILAALPNSAKPGAQTGAPTKGTTKNYQGTTYTFDGTQWVSK